jgi:restriction system protein
LLEVLSDGKEHEIKDVREQLATTFSLTAEDTKELIPSGRVTKLQNRVGWAATYLYRTRLSRAGIDGDSICRFPTFIEWVS